jgi:cytochrome c5
MKKYLCLLAIFSVMVLACERQEATSPQPAPTAEKPMETPPGGPATAPGAAAPEGTAAALEYNIDQATGEAVYQRVCATCHKEGIAGSPRQGDQADWAPRIAKGMNVLIQNAIQGYQGSKGVMPPRGGDASLTDDEVASAVAHMVELNR